MKNKAIRNPFCFTSKNYNNYFPGKSFSFFPLHLFLLLSLLLAFFSTKVYMKRIPTSTLTTTISSFNNNNIKLKSAMKYNNLKDFRRRRSIDNKEDGCGFFFIRGGEEVNINVNDNSNTSGKGIDEKVQEQAYWFHESQNQIDQTDTAATATQDNSNLREVNASPSDAKSKYKVSIIGSGNFGSAVARIIGENAIKHNDLFDSQVRMWVYEELVNGEKLTEIINTKHENVKYLPGVLLPSNVKAIADLKTAVEKADILVFVLPHQFINKIIGTIKENVPQDVISISLIKGIEFDEKGNILPISSLISTGLYSNKELEEAEEQEAIIEATNPSHDDYYDNLDTKTFDVQKAKLNRNEIKADQSLSPKATTQKLCNVLMGANVANEMAKDEFCEATIGSGNIEHDGKILQKLFHRPNIFHVNIVEDINGVELCGALKNIVALGAGFCDGLNLGGNTKAAIIRMGLIEMKSLMQTLYPAVQSATFFESCGVADLITTCYGGRNRKCAAKFAELNGSESWETIEKEELNGQKLQGTHTLKKIWKIIEREGLSTSYPFFHRIYQIAFEKLEPSKICFLSADNETEVTR